MRTRTVVPLVLLGLGLALTGCWRRDSFQSPGPVKTEVDYKMDAAAFDLETVTGLLKTKQVKDADDLQKKINDPQSGINNVDLDGDKMIDFVAVKEERQNENTRQLNFVAFPSSKNGADPTPVASVSFKVGEDRQQVQVVGGYPNYVTGWDSASYAYTVPYSGPSFGEMLFMSWLFSPRPVYVYAPYYTYGYHPYAVMPHSYAVTRRTTYRTETRVAPIARQAPPATGGPRFATPVQSHFRATPVRSASASDMSTSGRTASDFRARSETAPKPTATGFGAPVRSTTASPSASTGFGSSSASRPSASSSWGSRPSAPSSSWGSGSRPSSGSFGGRSSSFSSKRRY
jgi:hypothetical protein